jgi:4-hydroxythreonine-4-phosphate dehydrogenase
MLRMVDLPPLAITMGEPAGIGLEVALKAWKRRQRLDLPAFFLIDDPARVAAAARGLAIDGGVAEIAAPEQAGRRFATTIPVLPLTLAAAVEPGRPDPRNAPMVIESIERAVGFAVRGEAAGVVTSPIQKSVLQQAGFRHPGHTEFVAELAGAAGKAVMMLACPGLHVIPVTVHQALRRALRQVTGRRLLLVLRTADRALRRDFAIPEPRFAVSGLNPHAGEAGMLGREEIEIIAPALDELRAEGISIAGPLPADTMFSAKARASYDCAVCMYHDQALIPLKTIDFEHGVNITLGLPIVRTSPDHGTALDIAGRGVASWQSMVAAIWTAAMVAKRRAVAPLGHNA